MARAYRMSWEGAPAYRWKKMYRGKMHRVSCADLGASPTKEASYQAANEWWGKTVAELQRPNPAEEMVSRLDRADLLDTIRQGQAAKELLQGLGEYPLVPLHEDYPVVVEDGGEYNLQGISQLVEKLGKKPIQLDKTIGNQAHRYLEIERARGKAPNTFANLRHFVIKFQEFAGLTDGRAVSEIDEETTTDLYAWLRNGTLAPHSQKECFNVFKRFVRFASSQGLLDLPRNLDSRLFSFANNPTKIKTYPLAEVRQMLHGLSERLRLYALLALNCGMLGVDMATLKHEELQSNRIIRKRTKTKSQANCPEVEYVLWDETIRLLNRYPRLHEEYVLTSKTGTPLWRCEVKDFKAKKTNLVQQQWKRGKVSIPLKALRSVSATLLESHSVYGRFTTLFLGHSPASIKDRHYSAPPQALFDEALLWLREQILG